MRNSWQLPLIGILVLSLSPAMHAQKAPPIPGVTGTLVTPETAKDEKKAEDKAGAAVKDALTPNDTKGPLADLRPGTTVVIRHGSDVTEGVVSKIDRSPCASTTRRSRSWCWPTAGLRTRARSSTRTTRSRR